MRHPAPTAAQASRPSPCCTMGLEPPASPCAPWACSTTGTAQRASISAAVCPTGPLPSTATSGIGSALQFGPDLAVALRGPDPRPLDPGQLVPQPGDVERHAVLED